MALKIEIYLPTETTDKISEVEDLVLAIGDLLSLSHGNIEPDEFDLDILKSFIIIKDEEIPAPENFVDQDMFLLIPVESEDNE
ncbi:MAG: hypothetical protein ACHQ1D_01375 [Nitrososphaerales archaeon]